MSHVCGSQRDGKTNGRSGRLADHVFANPWTAFLQRCFRVRISIGMLSGPKHDLCHPSASATVDTFPEAIFVLGTALYFVTLVFLVLVRVRRPKWKGNAASSEAGPEFDDIANAES